KCLYPNVFNMLVGPTGVQKTPPVELAKYITCALLPDEVFLPSNLSVESLFDEYCVDEEGRPDKLLLVPEANILMSTWTKSDYGTRVASQFLDLHDCGRLSETFRQHKKKKTGGKRVVAETSTSVLLGGTFNVAIFPVEQIKQGIQRRF